jgi:hypothetical protein
MCSAVRLFPLLLLTFVHPFALCLRLTLCLAARNFLLERDTGVLCGSVEGKYS